MRRLIVLGIAMLAITLVFGFAVRAQDQGTPEPSPCVLPDLDTMGTPADASMTPAPSGSPVGSVACATPTDVVFAGSITIEMIDIAFEPNEVMIPANSEVTITLPNSGVSAHNFHIDELNIDVADVASGDSATVTINAPAGTYEFYCNVPGHREAGMIGTITVQ